MLQQQRTFVHYDDTDMHSQMARFTGGQWRSMKIGHRDERRLLQVLTSIWEVVVYCQERLNRRYRCVILGDYLWSGQNKMTAHDLPEIKIAPRKWLCRR